ncbi:isoprenylcysteine carboxylmethyltransferase family protein [Vineibacter terrae]|uniref:Isoprenylcysteine carboxylmethyltransferase family protein n=1 Tax=Vineibacter terrae TaxID=2586908 RepID=A0A5C8PV26_9HYPH|nr:isoprenylcysteine carboxylmethyltransferase family protein [Vineibacter terrae]TXL82202.1 isoprenylcysteine carboxylmethyltransferase family protein [Vineibacter terrae]
MTAAPQTSNVVIQPPMLFLIALAAGLLADRWIYPMDLIGLRWWTRQWLGGAVILAGVAVVVDCARRFRRAGTSVQPRRPSTAMVEGGLYRYSRNPIYMGLSTVHLGVAIADNNAWLPILLAPVLLVLRYGVIAREEAYLERRFGSQYAAYKARVRRWL